MTNRRAPVIRPFSQVHEVSTHKILAPTSWDLHYLGLHSPRQHEARKVSDLIPAALDARALNEAGSPDHGCSVALGRTDEADLTSDSL